MKRKEFTRNTKVAINNTCPWEMFIYSTITRSDFIIPAGAKNYKMLTYEVVENEVAKGNTFFVGVDGLGSHAAFQIVDQDIYRSLFDVDDDQTIISWEDVKQVIMNIDDRNEYENKLHEMIITKAEARSFYHLAANEIDWSNLYAFKKTTFESICRGVMNRAIYNV